MLCSVSTPSALPARGNSHVGEGCKFVIFENDIWPIRCHFSRWGSRVTCNHLQRTLWGSASQSNRFHLKLLNLLVLRERGIKTKRRLEATWKRLSEHLIFISLREIQTNRTAHSIWQ